MNKDKNLDNKDYIEQKIGREVGPPILIQMSSSEKGKQCDLYNHGSFHIVRECTKGYNWVDGRVDTIPQGYPFKIIDEKPEVKTCSMCKNEFRADWPFIEHDGENSCTRCYERGKMFNRDSYRNALREEFMIEFGLK